MFLRIQFNFFLSQVVKDNKLKFQMATRFDEEMIHVEIAPVLMCIHTLNRRACKFRGREIVSN